MQVSGKPFMYFKLCKTDFHWLLSCQGSLVPEKPLRTKNGSSLPRHYFSVLKTSPHSRILFCSFIQHNKILYDLYVTLVYGYGLDKGPFPSPPPAYVLKVWSSGHWGWEDMCLKEILGLQSFPPPLCLLALRQTFY